MYFYKPQEKPRRWGSLQDVQYAIKVNSEKIYDVDPDSIVLAMPLFWGLPALDFSGKNNHGTNFGTIYKDGRMYFDGSNDYTEVPDANTLDFVKEHTVIVRFWAESTQNNSYPTLIAKANVGIGFTQQIWALGYDNLGGVNKIRYRCETATGYSNGTWSSEWVTTTQVHFDSRMKLYAKGELDTDVACNTNLNITAQPIVIGCRRYGGTSNHFFTSYIEFVTVFDVAHTADQIALFYDMPYGLYQPVSRPVYFFQAAAGGVSPTSTIYGPLYGPFAGCI